MLARNFALLALTAFVTIPIRGYAVDTLPSVEEFALRGAVIEKCHAAPTDDDKAYAEVARASAEAELRRIWAQLSATDTSNALELSRKAMEIFGERYSKMLEDAKMKVKNIDCAELERQTKPAGR